MVDSATRQAAGVGTGFSASSTPAQRTRRARWRDGRLLLGVLLVAVSALVGARVLASADDTTSMWVADRTIPAGTRLSADDLTRTRVRFTTDDAARTYLATDDGLEGKVTVRQLSSGEFVPRAAIADRPDVERIEVPLSVAVGRLPADLSVGDQVDVWVVPKSTGRAAADASRLWERVRVIQAETVKGMAGGSARRQVLIAVPADRADRMPAALADLAAGEPVLVRRGS